MKIKFGSSISIAVLVLAWGCGDESEFNSGADERKQEGLVPPEIGQFHECPDGQAPNVEGTECVNVAPVTFANTTRNIGRYIKPFSATNQRQVFDRQQAYLDGFDLVTLDRTEEIVKFQNIMIDRLEAGQPLDIEKTIDEFPLVRSFFEKKATRLTPFSYGSSHPCGTYDNPIPNHRPPSQAYTFLDPVYVLLQADFHTTAGYACGEFEVSCGRDYTRGRSYSSSIGVCPSPIFRDQARVLVDGYSVIVQFGEPNPEIHSYDWPYWGWGVYALWWHYTY